MSSVVDLSVSNSKKLTRSVGASRFVVDSSLSEADELAFVFFVVEPMNASVLCQCYARESGTRFKISFLNYLDEITETTIFTVIMAVKQISIQVQLHRVSLIVVDVH